MLAYLVIREGTKWTDVFRLVPGRTVTIGRASTNQIVVKDERASRSHAEVFLTQGKWTLRDLDSRNGTMVGGEPVQGDYVLSPGDVVRIAHCQMAFVHDISKAFQDAAIDAREEEETVVGHGIADTGELDVSEGFEPTRITHRRGDTRYLRPLKPEEIASPKLAPKVGQAASKLCQLAFELANQTEVAAMAEVAMRGVIEHTRVDAGALLLAPRGAPKPLTAEQLSVTASYSETKTRYHRVSEFLANTVLREGEAVLARNVADDSMLAGKDSQGHGYATSVICTPIRRDQQVVGLIHLYSTSSDRTPDPDDLEFTLAVAENVALALKNLERQQELAEDLVLTRSEIAQLRSRLGAEVDLVGSSPALEQVQKEISRAAPSRATVLIRGESGVGKELVARAMHFASPRRKGPFVCLNCAALTETLLESELFGHEKGAFTGATDRKVGKFEAADKGTLMLDEIGEMSPAVQAKFLRVLEGHPFERVGGNKAIKVDVRVIAATNRDLEKAVRGGDFRRDLYFRLHVVEIEVPPLRKRGDDVVELADYFLQKFKMETGRRIDGFTEQALAVLRQYRWPGNVRELKNVVERAVVLAQGPGINAEDLTLSNLSTSSESTDLPLTHKAYEPLSLADMERRHIIATLDNTGWNKSRAASILGIERSTLDRKIRRYEIEVPQARSK